MKGQENEIFSHQGHATAHMPDQLIHAAANFIPYPLTHCCSPLNEAQESQQDGSRDADVSICGQTADQDLR